MKLFDVLLPRETAFFTHLNNQVDNFWEACVYFREFIKNVQVLTEHDLHAQVLRISEYEHKGDRIELFISEALDTTFITPLDREDIHAIVVSVDDALDSIRRISQKIEVYHVKVIPKNMLTFSNLVVDGAAELKKLIHGLKERKDLKGIVKNIHEIEHKADFLFHDSMAELFQKKDPIEIIKLKEIYAQLEDVVNDVQAIAKLVKRVLIKQG
ncbi:MAG: DUF47 family protein [archaeon]